MRREPPSVVQNRPATLRFVIDNLGWMVGSLALAVLVWYAAVSAQNPVEQRRFPSRIPVKFITEEGMLVVNEVPDTALVTLRAPRSVWEILEPSDIMVEANLAGLGPGTHVVDLHGRVLYGRQGVVADILPSQLTVELARRADKLVSIDVIRISEPPPGLTSIPSLNVQEARISGTEALVRRVVSAQARIDLQERRTSFSETVRVIPVDDQNQEVEGVTIVPAQVTIDMEIQPRPDVTELAVVAQLTGDLPDGYLRRNYNWEPKTVAVRGDRTTIESMNGVVSTEPIDLSGQTATFSQRVKLALPPGVVLVDPIDITVTVEIEPRLGNREFPNIPVQTQGLDPADFNIAVQPDRVNVIVNGPEPVLNELTPEDISVIAPLSGLSAGKYQVTLQGFVTKAGINSRDIVIPNARAEVTIIARNPTATPTTGPTRAPTATPSPTESPTPP
jgi:YbbR domain-containing protein